MNVISQEETSTAFDMVVWNQAYEYFMRFVSDEMLNAQARGPCDGMYQVSSEHRRFIGLSVWRIYLILHREKREVGGKWR